MKKLASIILFIILLGVYNVDASGSLEAAVNSSVHPSGLPKVDEILFKTYWGVIPEVIVDLFLEGQTDWIDGPRRIDLYNTVVAEGHHVSEMDPLAEISMMAINCRDYKETSGDPNLPLNDSNFRIALKYIYGMDDKEADILAYQDVPWTFAIGNPVPPGQRPWYNETIQMPNTNWSKAWTILSDAGYYVNTTDQSLYNPKGAQIRNLDVLHSGSSFWEKGPGTGFVTNFNDFMNYVGAYGTPNMTLTSTNFTTIVWDLLVNHEFDFICTGFSDLGVYVDWLYDMLHSDNIRELGWNWAGLSDTRFDEYTGIIDNSINTTEIIEAASIIQQIFVDELMPWFPISGGNTFSTSANDSRGALMNIISMPNYGPRNDWSWMLMHWNYSWPGGTVRAALDDAPHSLNAYTEWTSYGWQILGRAIQGLLMRSPEDLSVMPWIATNYALESWISVPELGIVNGGKATFWMRQDVFWHDLEPVNAYDCVANMKILRKYKPGRYSSTWANVVFEEASGPYRFDVYFSTMNLRNAHSVAETSLFAPEHVLEAVEQMVEDGDIATFFDWDPAYNPYSDLGLGDPPTQYLFMKQIVGTGPFVFDNYNRAYETGRVQRFEEFFVNAPVIGSVVGEWLCEPDTAYSYSVLTQNIAAKANNETGDLVPVTFDVKVYEDEVLKYAVSDMTLDPWAYNYLGPYTTSPYTAGSWGKHSIRVEVYINGEATPIHTYNHEFHAVPRRDVTTYSGDLIDDKVDMEDIFRLVVAYGSHPGSLRWDAACDVNDNWFVDVKDILAIALIYGWTAPG